MQQNRILRKKGLSVDSGFSQEFLGVLEVKGIERFRRFFCPTIAPR
jgi:hypothetical protein